MGAFTSKINFDRRDHLLLNIVNDFLNKDKSQRNQKKLLYPYLHPRGIKELASTTGFRIAYAVINLLGSLEVGKADDRIRALKCLRDEVLSIAHTKLRYNTARVLLQIMKEFVRAHGNTHRQLELAHDFRMAASGKPRVIRAELCRYHLLEMPEEWNQIAFDHHVHDASTKGRKSPTHLIMDAWIKGIRQLTVIYYNYVRPEVAEELLEAAEIMGITARIGVELSSRFRDQYVKLIWVPRGFSNALDFLCFLAELPMVEFMGEGKKVSEHQQQYVFTVLKEFNKNHRIDIEKTYGLKLDQIDRAEFVSFVGSGQPSILHLGKFIYAKLLPAIQSYGTILFKRYIEATPEERLQLKRQIEVLKNIDSETIVECYLKPSKNRAIPNPHVPEGSPDLPALLKLSPRELLNRLDQFHCGYRTTLNLTDLKAEDVLEILYDCMGMITHLEIFNLKDYVTGRTAHISEIVELQQAINKGNIVSLKRVIRGIILRLEKSENTDRQEKLRTILRDIGELQSYYKGTPLKSRICSDSTGSSRHLPGMGLVLTETLPLRAQNEIRNSNSESFYRIVPIRMDTCLSITYRTDFQSNKSAQLGHRWLNWIPGFNLFGKKQVKEWVVQEDSIKMESRGNIATLGGFHAKSDIELLLEPRISLDTQRGFSWKYLNGSLKNGLKVMIGFVPAFLTFALTKDWWLLAYMGAFIWFGITGLRNILQSILGGGGIRRSPLLRWNDYVSWERLSDSLLFTGFSVPLLDYVVKTIFLDRLLGITAATNAVALYSVIAIANGLYISSHNAFRGLPKGAVIGNFFRSILSIPLAIALNGAIGHLLAAANVPEVHYIMQKWAAVISKFASDCVAGVIEGVADRYNNIRQRIQDYSDKLSQIFTTCDKLELLFPEADMLGLLESPNEFIQKIRAQVPEVEEIIIIDALDLLYFWMYQPRAQSALVAILKTISQEERQILIRYQFILEKQREISQFFIDGIIGENFSKGLSFYLDHSKKYLEAINRMI